MKAAFLGIDPGITGGIAILDGEGLLALTPMPVMKVAGKAVIDAYGIGEFLEMFTPLRFGLVEEQQAMPKQGISSTFKTGYGYGVLVGILSSMGIPFATIKASEWKRRAKCPRDKDSARLTAARLWPDETALRLKKNHGLAEAALLAKLAKESA